MKSITNKAIATIVIPLAISFIITNIVSFFSVYNNTLEATGIEAYGCANITTALIDPNLMVLALEGDTLAQQELGKLINWTVEHKHIFRNQYILDLNGTVVATDDYTSEVDLKTGDSHPIDEETLEYIKTNKIPKYSRVYDLNGHSTLTGYAPVFLDNDPSKEIIAISAIDFDGKIVMERTIENIKSNLFFHLVQIILVILVSAWFINRTIKPIKVVQKKMREVSEGNLTTEMDINTKDEIEELAFDVNSLIARFKDILSEVSSNLIQVATTSEQLYLNAQNLSNLSNKNSNEMEEVNKASNLQREHINEINGILQSTTINIQRISEQLSNFVVMLKGTVNESVLGVQNMEATDQEMDAIENKIQSLNQLLLNLKNKSGQIDEIILFIKQISKQTNILSLNASIEAARAGKAGKGFTIVAEEIRNLSEQTDNSTKNIQGLLKEIQNDINYALLESEDVNRATKLGNMKIKETKNLFENISNRVIDANSHIAMTSNSVKTLSAELEEVAAKMDEIVNILNGIFEFTNNVSESINNQNIAFTKIVDQTDTLADLSVNLKGKIAYFKFE